MVRIVTNDLDRCDKLPNFFPPLFVNGNLITLMSGVDPEMEAASPCESYCLFPTLVSATNYSTPTTHHKILCPSTSMTKLRKIILYWLRLTVLLLLLLRGKTALVSVFNVAYGGGGFAFNFFLAKYASILFISLLFCIIFLGSDLYSFLFFILSLLFFLFYLCGFEILYLVFVMVSSVVRSQAQKI